MKGYRTIIFSSTMTLLGLIGFKVSPDTASHWADIFFAFWGITSILLRQITNTPVGTSLLVGVEQSLSKDDLSQIRQDVQTLLGHVQMTPVLASATGEILKRLDGLSAALQEAAAIAAVVAPPAPISPPASPFTPLAAEAPVSAPVGDVAAAITPPPVSAPSTDALLAPGALMAVPAGAPAPVAIMPAS